MKYLQHFGVQEMNLSSLEYYLENEGTAAMQHVLTFQSIFLPFGKQSSKNLKRADPKNVQVDKPSSSSQRNIQHFKSFFNLQW